MSATARVQNVKTQNTYTQATRVNTRTQSVPAQTTSRTRTQTVRVQDSGQTRKQDRRARKRRAKAARGARYFDYNLLVLVIVIICFGLIMLYSASSYTSATKFGDSAYYLKRQMMNMAIGLIPLVLLTVLDYRIWKKFGLLAYVGAIVLCLLVYVPGLGDSSHGSTRWLKIGPVSFQPSEIAKLAVILFLAMFLERIPKSIGTLKGLIKTFIILLPLGAIIAYQNLSTGLIVLAIAVCMIFVASPRYVHFVLVAIIGIVFIVVFIFAVGATYRSERIDAWLHPETATKGYQVLQGLYAIGSGGIFGKGLGNSIQKLGNVPEAQNDMIFSIICEELGLIGAICVILLFIMLLWRMMVIATNATDLYGALLVTGIMAHIALQVILNIAVVTNTIPNTGVTLPFISYGGTSVIFLMAEIGLALSVSKGIRLKKMGSGEVEELDG